MKMLIVVGLLALTACASNGQGFTAGYEGTATFKEIKGVKFHVLTFVDGTKCVVMQDWKEEKMQCDIAAPSK